MHAQSYKSIKLGYSYDFLLVLQRIEKRKHFICVGKVFLLYFPRCENNYKYFTYSLWNKRNVKKKNKKKKRERESWINILISVFLLFLFFRHFSIFIVFDFQTFRYFYCFCFSDNYVPAFSKYHRLIIISPLNSAYQFSRYRSYLSEAFVYQLTADLFQIAK